MRTATATATTATTATTITRGRGGKFAYYKRVIRRRFNRETLLHRSRKSIDIPFRVSSVIAIIIITTAFNGRNRIKCQHWAAIFFKILPSFNVILFRMVGPNKWIYWLIDVFLFCLFLFCLKWMSDSLIGWWPQIRRRQSPECGRLMGFHRPPLPSSWRRRRIQR